MDKKKGEGLDGLATNYLSEVKGEWYEKYKELDELVDQLDKMVGEINYIRCLVEQKLAEIDRFFTFSAD